MPTDFDELLDDVIKYEEAKKPFTSQDEIIRHFDVSQQFQSAKRRGWKYASGGGELCHQSVRKEGGGRGECDG